MNILISLLLVSLTQSFVVEPRLPRATHLPGTKISKLTIFDPPGINIRWVPVNTDEEAVLGYKISNPIKSQSKMYEYRISGADKSELIVDGLKLDTPYLVEVRTYGANEDGPLSSQIRFKIRSGNRTP